MEGCLHLRYILTTTTMSFGLATTGWIAGSVGLELGISFVKQGVIIWVLILFYISFPLFFFVHILSVCIGHFISFSSFVFFSV
jgi:hypothetical protein